MENWSVNPVVTSPSRTPLSENPTLLPGAEQACPKIEGKCGDGTSGFQRKARVLFADPGTLKRGENGPNRTPTRTRARQYLHGTPSRARKNAGRQPCSTSNTEASVYDIAPSTSHTRQPFEHFVLEQDDNFWKDHNVQVLIRIRPLNSAETAANGMSTCLRQESSHALTWLGQPESRFTFDHVACASTTQEDLFHVAGLPMVDNCIKGYNSSVFAYGQTGSGKTYTMLGDIEAMNHKLDPNCGITPRIFEYLFTKIEKEKAAHGEKYIAFTCKCSFLEIYNEQITDLLEPTSTNLQIHENPRKGLFVENLKEVEVHNVGDVMELLLQGAANRRVAQTRMNQESSRSHSVFTCVIESQWVTDSLTSFRFGRLNLVDLAGSERQKASGAEGERLREAANINKSLSTLGLVIMILVDVAQGKQRHVPYRDSKLTFLLQDSLGGNSKTAIIATVSPAIVCANETLSTLKFAQRAKFIQNNAVINEDASGDVKVLQSQIQDLKRELEKLREQRQLAQNSPLMVMKKTQINDGGDQLCTDFAIQSMEDFLAECLTREQEVLHEKNELAAENQQLNALIQAYERDLNYVKTMLQLKEDKFQRLEKVENSIISAEEYLQEENILLRQELLFVKDRMNNHPELLHFALENKHLIQQLRRHDELYGQEREMLMVEPVNVNFRQQVLNSLQGNLIDVKESKQIMSSTQTAAHKDKDNQMTHSQCLLPKGNLVTRADCESCNHSDNVNERALTDLVSLLEEGNQTLKEALQEAKSIKGKTFESGNWPKSLIKANTVHIRHKAVNYHSLQQLYDIVKDVEDCFEVLCNVAVGEKQQRKSESVKVNPHPAAIIYAPEFCKINQNCSPAEKMIEVSSQQCSLTNFTKERLLLEDDRRCKQSCETLSHGASAIAKDKICFHLRSKSQGSNSTVFFCKVAECGEILCERLNKQASHSKTEHEVKQKVYLDFVSHIHIALAMMQESFDAEQKKGPIGDFNSALNEWKQAFDDDAHQTCMEGLNRERILTQLQKPLAEMHYMLKDEDIRLATKLQAQRKQWLSEKIRLKHQLLRLQSDAVAKDREIAALQNEEAILAAIVGKLHKGEEWMRENLNNLKHQLEYSENKRLLAEQLFKESLDESTKDQIRSRTKLQKLVTEVRNNIHIFMNVRKQLEIVVASLQEAEISQNNITDKMNFDALEGKLEKVHQPVDMQKQLIMMETGMTTMLAVLEGRLQKAESFWKGENGMILLDLWETKLDALEKKGQASDALKRFKHDQEIIREAELLVNALTNANEDAKMQKLNLLHQWHEERESMVTKICELETLIVQKDSELQLKEQEVRQLILKRETMMHLDQKAIYANVPDGEEKRKNTTKVLKISSHATGMSSSRQELLTAIFPMYNQLYASKFHASAFGNTCDSSSGQMLAEKLVTKNLPCHDINHLGLAQEDFRKEKQKQVPSKKVELLPFQNTQVQHKQAQMSSELHNLSKEMITLECKLEKSRYEMLQTYNSHATTNLIFQGRESKLEKKAWLQEAYCQEYETDEALEKGEKANRALTVLQNTTLEILAVLQHYDKSTSLLLEKLEHMVATISGILGSEDTWVHFLNNFKHALSMLEEDTRSCLSFSNVICKELEKTLAEKQRLERELERNKELLRGSFFDLSLLQENTVEHINMKSEIDGAFSFIQSLQEELDIKNQRFREKEVQYANLEHEKIEDTNRLLFLETSLSDAQKHTTSVMRENADMKQSLEVALSKIESLEASLEEKKETIEKLELELLDVDLLTEQRTTQIVNGVKRDLSSTLAEKEWLQNRVLTLEEELDTTRLAAEKNKKLVDEAQQIAETSKCRFQEKETEVQLLEKSIHELENTINALENQVEILKREIELQQLSKEDLEMDLQALRQKHYHTQSSKKECSEDTKGQQEQIEIMTLRKELTDKSAEIKDLKLHLEELISAAEKQAAAHYRKVASLEAMADNPMFEKRQASPKPGKAGDRNFGKCSTSPFKCLSPGLAQQINCEIDEELYSNRCRIDELEDLAASRQKEIFRLNKKLADAETMTYDVIRDLLGVKSDIATHASYLDYEELVKISKMASHYARKAIHKEKELDALQDCYNKERASWLADTARRQAEVVAALVAVEKLRHKDLLLKAENKRLKADLSRQKKRLLQIQDKLKSSSRHHHGVCDVQMCDPPS